MRSMPGRERRALNRVRINPNGQLFLKLSRQRLLWIFPGVHLASREFPQAPMFLFVGASIDEHFAIRTDQRSRHDEDQCRNILQLNAPE